MGIVFVAPLWKRLVLETLHRLLRPILQTRVTPLPLVLDSMCTSLSDTILASLVLPIWNTILIFSPVFVSWILTSLLTPPGYNLGIPTWTHCKWKTLSSQTHVLALCIWRSTVSLTADNPSHTLRIIPHIPVCVHSFPDPVMGAVLYPGDTVPPLTEHTTHWQARQSKEELHRALLRVLKGEDRCAVSVSTSSLPRSRGPSIIIKSSRWVLALTTQHLCPSLLGGLSSAHSSALSHGTMPSDILVSCLCPPSHFMKCNKYLLFATVPSPWHRALSKYWWNYNCTDSDSLLTWSSFSKTSYPSFIFPKFSPNFTSKVH